MYTPNDFIGKRIVLKDCVHSQNDGQTTIVTHAQYNDSGDIIIQTEIQNPEDRTTELWVNASQVDYIKEFDYYLNQYMDKQGQTITLPYESSNKSLKLVGQFDVYAKEFIKLN